MSPYYVYFPFLDVSVDKELLEKFGKRSENSHKKDWRAIDTWGLLKKI